MRDDKDNRDNRDGGDNRDGRDGRDSKDDEAVAQIRGKMQKLMGKMEAGKSARGKWVFFNLLLAGLVFVAMVFLLVVFWVQHFFGIDHNHRFAIIFGIFYNLVGGFYILCAIPVFLFNLVFCFVEKFKWRQDKLSFSTILAFYLSFIASLAFVAPLLPS